MSMPVYRSISVERHIRADRAAIFAAGEALLAPGDEVISREPPWRLVTRRRDPDLELFEITVAVVEHPGGLSIVSVSTVVGPEANPGALDGRLTSLRADLDALADAVTGSPAS